MTLIHVDYHITVYSDVHHLLITKKIPRRFWAMGLKFELANSDGSAQLFLATLQNFTQLRFSPSDNSIFRGL